MPIEVCLKLENTQYNGKINLSKWIATYSFAKWSNHDVYLVTNFPFPFNSIAGDEIMSKTGKGSQAVPSWFSIPLGPPVRAWGSTGRLAGRFCRAAAHTTTGNGTQHQHCTHTTHTAPIWTHRKVVNPKFQQTIFLLASDKRVWGNAWAVRVDQNNY